MTSRNEGNCGKRKGGNKRRR